MEEKYIRVFFQKQGMYDHEYFFYENGKVFHKYDRNSYHRDIEEWLEIKDICTSDRAVFLKECELKDIEDLKHLFEKYS